MNEGCRETRAPARSARKSTCTQIAHWTVAHMNAATARLSPLQRKLNSILFDWSRLITYPRRCKVPKRTPRCQARWLVWAVDVGNMMTAVKIPWQVTRRCSGKHWMELGRDFNLLVQGKGTPEGRRLNSGLVRVSRLFTDAMQPHLNGEAYALTGVIPTL